MSHYHLNSSVLSSAIRTGRLDLHGRSLFTLPSEIFESGVGNLADQLQILDASENRLSVIPSDIGRLTQLRELHLDNNSIRTLPIELIELEHLKAICLDNNPLEPALKKIYDASNTLFKSRARDPTDIIKYLADQVVVPPPSSSQQSYGGGGGADRQSSYGGDRAGDRPSQSSYGGGGADRDDRDDRGDHRRGSSRGGSGSYESASRGRDSPFHDAGRAIGGDSYASSQSKYANASNSSNSTPVAPPDDDDDDAIYARMRARAAARTAAMDGPNANANGNVGNGSSRVTVDTRDSRDNDRGAYNQRDDDSRNAGNSRGNSRNGGDDRDSRPSQSAYDAPRQSDSHRRVDSDLRNANGGRSGNASPLQRGPSFSSAPNPSAPSSASAESNTRFGARSAAKASSDIFGSTHATDADGAPPRHGRRSANPQQSGLIGNGINGGGGSGSSSHTRASPTGSPPYGLSSDEDGQTHARGGSAQASGRRGGAGGSRVGSAAGDRDRESAGFNAHQDRDRAPAQPVRDNVSFESGGGGRYSDAHSSSSTPTNSSANRPSALNSSSSSSSSSSSGPAAGARNPPHTSGVSTPTSASALGLGAGRAPFGTDYNADHLTSRKLGPSDGGVSASSMSSPYASADSGKSNASGAGGEVHRGVRMQRYGPSPSSPYGTLPTHAGANGAGVYTTSSSISSDRVQSANRMRMDGGLGLQVESGQPRQRSEWSDYGEDNNISGNGPRNGGGIRQYARPNSDIFGGERAASAQHRDDQRSNDAARVAASSASALERGQQQAAEARAYDDYRAARAESSMAANSDAGAGEGAYATSPVKSAQADRESTYKYQNNNHPQSTSSPKYRDNDYSTSSQSSSSSHPHPSSSNNSPRFAAGGASHSRDVGIVGGRSTQYRPVGSNIFGNDATSPSAQSSSRAISGRANQSTKPW